MTFRPLERSDFAPLGQWLALPHVARWWHHGSDPASVESDFGPVVDGQDPTEVFVVAEDGRDVGLIQRYRLEDDPSWERAVAVGSAPRPAIGIDYLIGDEEATGRGLGPIVIAGLVDDSWHRYPEVRAVVVAVQQANRRSWRALEKAGFTRDWSGMIRSDDPSDRLPSHVYILLRPTV